LCITHEHSDHVRSAKAFLKAVHAPVAASGGTLTALEHDAIIPKGTEKILMHAGEPQTFGGLSVTSFKAYHDAAEPTGYIIGDGQSRIGVCLDTHKISAAMYETLSGCDAVVIESNYSEPAMKTDRFPACSVCRQCGAACGGNCQVMRLYPRYLKDRIRNDGHLSNEASAQTIAGLSENVGTIALAHLSENYNRPNIAREMAEDAARENGCEIFVSDQLPEYRERRMVKFSV
ncbi:MAG: MBL fold metallo-hydrolase, partial [Methanocorpusculum sp.]|nr:MBL fold metallo-hydrolase [Methanocorpusculum sp.]